MRRVDYKAIIKRVQEDTSRDIERAYATMEMPFTGVFIGGYPMRLFYAGALTAEEIMLASILNSNQKRVERKNDAGTEMLVSLGCRLDDRQLAERMRCSPQRIKKMLSRLIKFGVVERGTSRERSLYTCWS